MKNLYIKLLPISLFFLVISPFQVSCANLKENTKSGVRTIDIDKKFKGIKTQAGLEIVYTQNSEPSKAIISGPENIVQGITWETDNNGILSFQYPKQEKNNGKVTIQLNGENLYNYQASSAGIIKVLSPCISPGMLNISVTSSGKIIMFKKVDSKNNVINIAGSSGGEIIFNESLSGNVINITTSSSAIVKISSLNASPLNFAGSSTGILEIQNLNSNVTNVTLSSGSEFSCNQGVIKTLNLSATSGGEASFKNINATTLNIEVSSSASTTLKGYCEEANLKASSGGEINCKELKVDKITNSSTSSRGSIILKK